MLILKRIYIYMQLMATCPDHTLYNGSSIVPSPKISQRMNTRTSTEEISKPLTTLCD
jgi:hypothetical protein